MGGQAWLKSWLQVLEELRSSKPDAGELKHLLPFPTAFRRRQRHSWSTRPNTGCREWGIYYYAADTENELHQKQLRTVPLSIPITYS